MFMVLIELKYNKIHVQKFLCYLYVNILCNFIAIFVMFVHVKQFYYIMFIQELANMLLFVILVNCSKNCTFLDQVHFVLYMCVLTVCVACKCKCCKQLYYNAETLKNEIFMLKIVKKCIWFGCSDAGNAGRMICGSSSE